MDYMEIAIRLGQNPNLLEAIQRSQIHPAMSAFGLWGDDEFANLTSIIYTNRESLTPRPAIEFQEVDS